MTIHVQSQRLGEVPPASYRADVEPSPNREGEPR
jgi:hypothetical protein